VRDTPAPFRHVRESEMRCNRLKISQTDGRLSVDYRRLKESSTNIAVLPIGPMGD